jgi:hypothetical protein
MKDLIDRDLLDLIDAFMHHNKNTLKGAWLQTSKSEFYVRKSMRIDPTTKEYVIAIDMANITVKAKYRGQGILTNTIEYLTKMYPEYAIYFECVHNFSLRKWLKANDYLACGSSDEDMCFIRLPIKPN